jgi:hypothetical protein
MSTLRAVVAVVLIVVTEGNGDGVARGNNPRGIGMDRRN